MLYDVTVWSGPRLICTAENIVAGNEEKAVENALRAIRHRRYSKSHVGELVALKKHLELPSIHPAPDGVRVFVAEKPRGVKVIG